MNWAAESLRVTLFTVATLRPEHEIDLWEKLTGSPPQVDEFNRVVGLRRQASELQENLRGELQIQANRIDWFLAPGVPEVPGVAFIPDALHKFRKFVSDIVGWLPALHGPFARLAVGAVLLAPVGDRKEGYETLMRLVPAIRLDDVNDEVSDLFFQINYRISPEILSNVKINRLMKWSVAELTVLALNLGAGNHASTTRINRSGYFLRAEADFNTAPLEDTRPPLESSECGAIFEQMTKYVAEVVGGSVT